MGSSPAGRANLPALPSSLDDALGAVLRHVVRVANPMTLVPLWGSVDLDAAATSIPAPEGSSPVLDDDLLGARVRLISLAARPGEPPDIAVAEPSTEGPLAGFLARYGEGWAAVYLLADAGAPARLDAAGIALSNAATGPYGIGHRVLATDRSGPFILLALRAAR